MASVDLNRFHWMKFPSEQVLIIVFVDLAFDVKQEFTQFCIRNL
jgi:hypothetical protein